MKKFIKNSYLFLILFIIVISKNYILSFFARIPDVNIKDAYIQSLEDEIEEIKLIENTSYKDEFYYGKVIYQNPYKKGFISIVTGSKKVKKGDLVLSDSVLIGVINKVDKKTAEVKTIYAEDFALPVRINNCYGILKNDTIEGIDKYCPVGESDEVYTSDLSPFNEKFLIGTINKVIKDKNGISDTYILKPMKNFSNLNYLIIIGGN